METEILDLIDMDKEFLIALDELANSKIGNSPTKDRF